jgi:hypothetical protein
MLKPIRHTDHIFMAGSCFTEQMSQKLRRVKFQVTENPHGILFNPVSIATSIRRYCTGELYCMDDLFHHEDLWGSWDHHTRFSETDAERCLKNINDSLQLGAHTLKQSNWLILTLGSAFVYQKADGRVVANCHKVPADRFVKKLLHPDEIRNEFSVMLDVLEQNCPGVNVMLTISPVRHLRDGFVENNRSKANLIQAVHELVEGRSNVHYFPSYELVIDDLRDYRFYAEDMVHPNYQATQYVYERFLQACIDERDHGLIRQLNQLATALSHRIQHQGTRQHQDFFQKQLHHVRELKLAHPYLDLSEEEKYFSALG